MRVDFSQEIEPGDPVLEIPWTDPHRPKQSYVDVKRRPDAVFELDECRRYPELGQFLLHVNSPESSFHTAKCDVWTTKDLTLEERLEFGLPCKVGSYVDLLFDRADLQGRVEAYQQLASAIEQRMKDHRAAAQLEIMIRRCLFHLENRWGYYATIFVHAYGASPQEAESRWDAVMRVLAETLVSIDREVAWGGARPPAVES